MKSILKFNLLLCAIACTIMQMSAQSQIGWRGPARNGIYDESGLLKIWSAEGPQLLWEKTDIGKGYSSPVLANNRLYITSLNEDGDKEIFSAYTLDGEKIYETEYGTPWEKSYPEARTTPAINNGKAFIISGSGEIVCIDTANGEIVWKVNGGALFERKTGAWGTSECPLVFDDKVIFTPSGEQTTMVALNKDTGETIWESRPLGDEGCYVSPLLITYKGKRQIIGSTGITVIGVDPDNGNIDWTFDEWGKKGEGKIAINTPLYSDGHIFVSHGYDINAVMLKLNDNLTEVSVAWRNNDLDTHHGGFVLVDDIIYGSNWINNNQGNWVAVDWKTGETRYEMPWDGKGKGSIITADGMLYTYDERRGTVGLVNPTPEKFDVVSEFRINKGEGPHWAHPAIENGVLYIRHGSALMAFKIK